MIPFNFGILGFCRFTIKCYNTDAICQLSQDQRSSISDLLQKKPKEVANVSISDISFEYIGTGLTIPLSCLHLFNSCSDSDAYHTDADPHP
jgi:hypothetical protein